MATAMRKEFLKAKKVTHPNSRKSIAIAKRTRKITNRQKAKMNGLIKQNLVGEKMLWIKEHMIPNICPYTPELTARLLETYITRHDEEMEQIVIKRSISYKRNKQHASREDVLRMTREREQEEYDTCGIEIPDILNPIQCEMLRNWNGELRYMTNFKFRRFGKKHLNEALKKANKESKENKDIQTKVSKKPQNSEEVKFEEKIENSLNKSIDSSENKQSIECIMEIE
ncbi:translation machinery-associated protein 16 [Apis mellifera caucasica]|nr:translation machinery-associated protein 16 [Apis mellifera caucasica]KAG6802479.1 translation machinery-associated protein 16 [Apis mellifera caucasica]KAG9432228.1 translation machinery-associated protein 16 [Apis mellifera carnica]